MAVLLQTGCPFCHPTKSK